MIRPAAAAALAALCWPTAASADWESTRWGMTADEVVAASDGTASRTEDRSDTRVWDQRNLAEGRFVQDAITYTAGYYFDRKTKRLTMVTLTFEDDLCDDAYANFQSRFGPGEVENVSEAVAGTRARFVVKTTNWRTAEPTEVTRFSDITIPPTDVRSCKVFIMSHDLAPRDE